MSAAPDTIPVDVMRRAQALPLGTPLNGVLKDNRSMSSAEKRVLRVLCDSTHHAKTHREKAEAARVSESRYYQILADPWFKQQEKSLMLSHLQGELAPIMQASIDTAKRLGRDGHADRRMLLEVATVYEPRRQVDVSHTVKPVGVIVGVMHADL